MKPADRAWELVNGFRASQVVRAAVEFRIPDLLAGAPRSADDLSVATHLDRGRLHRILRGLAALGVVAEDAEGRFSNTPVGDLFREGVAGSRRPLMMYMLPESYGTWGHLLETLRTGETGQKLAYGVPFWDLVEGDADFGARFNSAMASMSEQVVTSITSSIDFADARLIVDVGGGLGGLAGGIVKVFPHLRGIVCDLRAALVATPAYLAQLGVADRCSLVECDFFESVPSGGDVYLLKDIIHDWDDERGAAILAVCRRAMRPGARIVIVERLVPSHVTQDPAHLNAVMADLQMMVHFGSRERTLEEFQAMLKGAGFSSPRLVPGEVYKFVEATAVS